MALPDLSKNSVSAPPPTFNEFSDDQLLSSFKQDPTTVARKLIKQPSQLDRFWKLLEHHFPQDQELVKAYDKTQNILGKIPPAPQPQTAPAAPAQEIPVATAEQLTQQEPAVAPKENDLNAENAPKIEEWMNGLKDHVYNSFAQSAKKDVSIANQTARRDVGASQMFTRSLLNSLSLYRGGLAGFYLSEGSKELIFSALGPIGDAFRSLYEKDVQRKMSWMKNPLNPNVIYYYLNSLPTREAFKILYHPARSSFAILANGGAPFISKIHYQEDKFDPNQGWIKETKSKFVFAPLHRATQFSHGLADKLDKASGIPTDFFSPSRFQNSPYDAFIKQKNKALTQALENLNKAKNSGNKLRIKLANQTVGGLIKRYDGPFGKSLLRNSRYNAARRLRQTHRDPISFLLALIGGFIWDASAGLVLSALRVATTKILNAIPGVNVLRARVTEFFTSNRWLTTARIGGTTIPAFLKGTFSLTTASTTYAGASIGGWIANALGRPAYPFQVIGGGIGTTFGSIYTTSLKLASNPGFINWIKEIRYWENIINTTGSLAQKAAAQTALNKLSLKGFRLGPLSKLANVLYKNPFIRLPFNGLVIADLGVKYLGWNPVFAYPSLVVGDWLWQVKGPLASAFGKWFVKTPLGRWIGNQVLSVQTWFTENVFMKPIAWEFDAMIGKIPVKWGLRSFWQGLQNFWSKVEPFAKNLFNPGFFMGAQFLGSVFMSLGLPVGVAHLAGALTGAGVWWGIHATYQQAIVGAGAKTLAQWSASGWFGYFAGLGLQGLLSLFGIHGAWMQFLPLAGSLIATVGVALIPALGSFFSGLLINVGYFASNVAWTLGISSTAYAAGLAAAATAISIGLVAGLTIFFGFVIYSGFWVPLQQSLHAGPQSACFNLQTSANITASGSAEICSKFTVTTDLLTEKGYIRNEIGIYNLLLSDYSRLENNITKATRQIPNQLLENLNYIISPEFLHPGNPDVATNRYTFPISENIVYSVPNYNGTIQGYLVSWLSTFTGSPDSNKKTIFQLIEQYGDQFPGLQQMVDSSFTLLEQVHADKTAGNADTVKKFEKMRDFTKDQKDAYNPISDKLVAAKNSTTLEKIKNNLESAKTQTQAAAEPNPFSEKISELENSCQYQTDTCKELIQLYQSWPNFFNNQLTAINNLDTSSDLADLKANVASVADSANFTFNSLNQQYQSYKRLAKELDDFQNNLNSWLDILNAVSPAPDQIKNILAEVFNSTFGDDKTYFFTPNGTRYEICVKGTYVGDPDKPIRFYSETDIVQPGFMGFGGQNACSAIAPTTINP